ncbi:acyl-CoA dehydrogenase [Pueribacillus theae]|uniref:Acyl-CoA dehydrogenase n=2 Tax=Pueribacillus theae TaxID=2171751 RepID=A0A2U1K4Z2_9BACI|nr:acyl-CoA dehydrogenase [Pueribacillus theae]
MTFNEWPARPKVKLGDLGAEIGLYETASALQTQLNDFAKNKMRPIGQTLDRLSAEKVIAEESQFWEFRKQYTQFGINVEALATFAPEDIPDIFCVIFEELGYGDAGLAISTGVDLLPHYMASKFGNDFVAKKYDESLIGCWAITEPDHGTDSLDPEGRAFQKGGDYGTPGCSAEITDGKIIINGQKSAWVSNGPIAELAILYCQVKTKDGKVDPSHGAVVIVPLDAPGVSKGPALEKMGQRSLPQGEIFFENVKLDIDHLLIEPKDYEKGLYAIHSEANTLMGAVFTGCARAAYEYAYDYAHERRQGGVPIIQHQDVKRRIFHMARKVELSRAITRRVARYNMLSRLPALQAAMFTKITATEHALEVASAAVQLFGGNGVTLEYPVEKIFRDARSSLIEDGCNEALSIMGGDLLTDFERAGM